MAAAPAPGRGLGRGRGGAPRRPRAILPIAAAEEAAALAAMGIAAAPTNPNAGGTGKSSGGEIKVSVLFDRLRLVTTVAGSDDAIDQNFPGQIFDLATIINRSRTGPAGKQILVDGTPLHLKGVAWNPVPKGGAHPADLNFAAAVEEDAKLMQKMGINAVRTYEPIVDKWVLDTLWSKGLLVAEFDFQLLVLSMQPLSLLSSLVGVVIPMGSVSCYAVALFLTPLLGQRAAR
eukprot:Skav233382  [mRNA]  locus=scaffold1038:147333:152668:+ [translate_table: standard]